MIQTQAAEHIRIYMYISSPTASITKKTVRKNTVRKILRSTTALCGILPRAQNNNPFHVFVKGKGSLILVLPDGVKYVANWQSYVGHIAIYEKITGKTVTAANSLDAIGAFGGIKGKINDILINDKTSKKNACFTDEFINETGDSGTKT